MQNPMFSPQDVFVESRLSLFRKSVPYLKNNIYRERYSLAFILFCYWFMGLYVFYSLDGSRAWPLEGVERWWQQ